jgi:hypothetical protein
LKFEVEDGRNIHFWFDWWHMDGVLYEKYGHRVVCDAHSKIEAKLSTVLKKENWNWRPAQSEDLVEIQSRLSLVEIGEKDVQKWVISKPGRYTNSETWETLRDRQMQMAWWKLIWFPLAIPKQAFVLWLAMKDNKGQVIEMGI